MNSVIKQNWHLCELSTHPFYFCNLLLINCFLVFGMSWSYDKHLSYSTKDLFFSFFFLSSQIQVELFISQNGISKEHLNNKHLILLLEILFHPIFVISLCAFCLFLFLMAE